MFIFFLQIVGAFWYILSVERNDTCWQMACERNGHDVNLLYCGNSHVPGYNNWSSVSNSVLTEACTPDGDDPPFDFGIFEQALSSGIVSSNKFVSKYLYCLWWGLQNLRLIDLLYQTGTDTDINIVCGKDIKTQPQKKLRSNNIFLFVIVLSAKGFKRARIPESLYFRLHQRLQGSFSLPS